MRRCCEEVTGGVRITLLLMIIKRTICAKSLGCLLFSPHMEWMFYVLSFWMSLYVFELKSMQLKRKLNIVLCFYASVAYWRKAALIKGIQWCTIWVPKYTTKHNIRQAHLRNMVLHEKIYSPRYHFKCTTNSKKKPQKCKHDFYHSTRVMQESGFIDATTFYWQKVAGVCSSWFICIQLKLKKLSGKHAFDGWQLSLCLHVGSTLTLIALHICNSM